MEEKKDLKKESESKYIEIEDFLKVQIKVGKILSAEFVPESEKLIKFIVDLGEEKPRQILSGVRSYYPEPEVLIGRFVPVVSNLKPRKMAGLLSEGMILYVIGEGVKFSTLEPSREIEIGSFVS